MTKQTFFIPIFSLCVILIALLHQHYFGMEPCAWCVFQRFFFSLIFFTYFIGFIFNKLQRQVIYFISFFSLLGIITAIYQTFVANYSESCSISFAETFMSFTQLNKMFPFIFESYALCADANISLIGIPYSVWGLLSFCLIFVFSIHHLYKTHSNH